ncbi:MAG TPA: CrcB family protein [Chthoniobacterales bacterium]|jgi:CrcB protein
MLSYLYVSLGGALGSAARFWISGLIAERYGETFPLGTLLVNVSGSFVIGIFAALPGARRANQASRMRSLFGTPMQVRRVPGSAW